MSNGKHTAEPVNYDAEGGPAFPASVRFHSDGGMTLRDYFAAKAMQGDISCQTRDTGFINFEDQDALLLGARNYYKMADAMLKVRQESATGTAKPGRCLQTK